jgi:hypothetical protein
MKVAPTPLVSRRDLVLVIPPSGRRPNRAALRRKNRDASRQNWRCCWWRRHWRGAKGLSRRRGRKRVLKFRRCHTPQDVKFSAGLFDALAFGGDLKNLVVGHTAAPRPADLPCDASDPAPIRSVSASSKFGRTSIPACSDHKSDVATCTGTACKSRTTNAPELSDYGRQRWQRHLR